MLKIKDNIELKELEKFGFKEYIDHYFYEIASNYGNSVELQIWKENRTLLLSVNYEEYFTEDIDIIFDIIEAGLVEKV